MISASIQNIAKAEAEEHAPGEYHNGFSVVSLYGKSRNINEAVKLFLPAGTGTAVAACINVAIAAGEKAEREEKLATLRARWNSVCEDMNLGRWPHSEAEALAEIERIKSQIAQIEAAA